MSEQSCNCLTFTTNDGRNKLFDLIGEKEIRFAAAPFGLSDDLPLPEQMIVRDQEHLSPIVETRLNQQLHAKFLVTEQFVVHGSSNFTDNSLRHEHEVFTVTYRDCCEQQYETFISFFKDIWHRSREHTINDTVMTQ